MYPKLVIDLNKLKQNLDAVSEITKDHGNCTLAVVTKVLCADHKVAELIANHPKVDFIADSRIQNIASYTDLAHEKGKKTLLLRIPMQSELADVIRYVDLCQISEISTIRLLNQEAEKAGKIQKIIMMIDLGDLREGFFFKDRALIHEAVKEILEMKNIELFGISVNLTCYGAIIPKNDNLSVLVEIAEEIEKEHGIKLNIVSGGNSSSIYLVDRGELPNGINNLRLGEAFAFGTECAYGDRLPGTTGEAFILEAEIVELKDKPSLPIGESGKDAFGNSPVFEDRGPMDRAIIAIGKQDVDLEKIVPVDERIEIMGGSSDHIILDVTNCKEDNGGKYKVGDIVRFTLFYPALLSLTTSKYVEREYV